MPIDLTRLKSLFVGKARNTRITVPAGERIYAIGDVHGRADLLEQLHDMIARDAQARGWARKRLIYLGDYIDRGPESRRVMALAMGDSPQGFSKVHLRGNHEDMLQEFLRDPRRASAWLNMGGDAVLREYGVPIPSEFGHEDNLTRASSQLAGALLPQEREFLLGLKPCYRAGGYFFTHAGVRPGVPLDQQSEQDLTWIRAPFLNYNNDFGAVVVHGHTICNEVEIKTNRIGIDTGAHATGKLTCLILETNKRWLLQTGHELLTAFTLP